MQHLKDNAHILQERTPRTSDFTTMYTNLPHPTIKTNVEHAIREAHAYEQQQQLQQHGLRQTTLFLVPDEDDRFTWSRTPHTGRTPDTGSLTVEQLIQHLHFIVDNIFLLIQDRTVRRQCVGLPMGTNASPEIATLTLYWVEANFIDKLLLENTREAQLHAHTHRFIDDVLTWNTLPPPPDIYGLEWKETTNTDNTCTFLGTTISTSQANLKIGIFDKALEWTFKVICYPSATSNAPAHQAAGVFTGQLTRFARACNNVLQRSNSHCTCFNEVIIYLA